MPTVLLVVAPGCVDVPGWQAGTSTQPGATGAQLAYSRFSNSSTGCVLFQAMARLLLGVLSIHESLDLAPPRGNIDVEIATLYDGCAVV